MIDKELLQTQTDSRWADVEMTNRITIKGYGCLVTSMSNILICEYPQLINVMNPGELDKFLDKNSGYTPEGYMKWDVVGKKFGFTMTKYFPADNIKINPDSYYIAQVKYKNTGHFCNILKFDNQNTTYFDVYSGITRIVKTCELLSIREIKFNKIGVK